MSEKTMELSSFLEIEKDIRKIVQLNDRFEKKQRFLIRQRNKIEANLEQYDLLSSAVRRLASGTNREQENIKIDINNNLQETRSLAEESSKLVESKFEKLEGLHDNDVDSFDIEYSLRQLSYDVENLEDRKGQLMEEFTEVSAEVDELNRTAQNLDREKELEIKAIRKLEKEISTLTCGLNKKRSETDQLRVKTTAVREEMENAKSEMSVSFIKKQEAEKETKAMEEILKKSSITTEEKLENLKKVTKKVSAFDFMMMKTALDANMDWQLISKSVDDDNDIKTLIEELITTRSVRPETGHDETVDKLQKSLEIAKSEKEAVEEEVKRLRRFSDKLKITNELMSRKISGYASVTKQIEENTEILNGLKVSEKATTKKSKKSFKKSPRTPSSSNSERANESSSEESNLQINDTGTTISHKSTMKTFFGSVKTAEAEDADFSMTAHLANYEKQIELKKSASIKEIVDENDQTSTVGDPGSSDFNSFWNNMNSAVGKESDDDEDNDLIAPGDDVFNQSNWESD